MRLAQRGELPSYHTSRWKNEAAAIRRIRRRAVLVGRSEELHTDGRDEQEPRSDASLLMLPLVGYGDPRGPRITGTIDAVCRTLQHGDFVYRYRAADGLSGKEGSFLNCSFWLVSALAKNGASARRTA